MIVFPVCYFLVCLLVCLSVCFVLFLDIKHVFVFKLFFLVCLHYFLLLCLFVFVCLLRSGAAVAGCAALVDHVQTAVL